MNLILIDDNNIKDIVINKLYNLINISNFRYKLLKSTDLLEQIKNEHYYISYNTKGISFFLIFFTLENINHVYLINRKFLSYNKNSIDINKIIIYKCDSNLFSNKLFTNTLLDIKKVETNKYIILDIFILNKINFLNIDMVQKMNYIYGIYNLYFDKSIYNLFSINTLYKLTEIKKLLLYIKNNNINSIIFYPYLSGINIIFIDCIKKYTINNDDQNISFFETKDSYYNYLINKKYNNYDVNKKEIFWVNKTPIIDVYILQKINKTIDVSNSTNEFALIPNIKTSHMCYNNLLNINKKKFLCYYNNKFNKWVPVSIVT